MNLINITFAVDHGRADEFVALLRSELAPAMLAHGYTDILVSRVRSVSLDGWTDENETIALQARIGTLELHQCFLGEKAPLIFPKFTHILGEGTPMFITELDVLYSSSANG